MTSGERMAVGLILLNTANVFLKASDPDGWFDITMHALSWLFQAGLGLYLFVSAMARRTANNEKEHGTND